VDASGANRLSGSIVRRATRAGLAAAVALAAAVTASAAEPVELVISDSHHHVLPHWLRAAESGVLPAGGVTVVHFDAHPDLSVPKVAVVTGRPRPEEAALPLDIASFQLAAAYWGLVDRVVWVRPAWAEGQLPDGERRFTLGALPDGRLRVDDPSDHYVVDADWAPAEALASRVRVSVRVLTLDEAVAAPDLASGPIVLDVDLDGFATRNPGADALRAVGVHDEDLATLRRSFGADRLDLPAAPDARVRAFADLLDAARAAASGGLVDVLAGALALWRAGVDVPGLLALQRVAARAGERLPADVLIEEARFVVGLPEQGADTARTEATARALGELARRLQPRLVTVARSVDDGYTPPRDWPAIEWALLRALADALGPGARVRFDPGLRPAPASGARPRAAQSTTSAPSSASTGPSPARR
jgi:hypothetical protein